MINRDAQITRLVVERSPNCVGGYYDDSGCLLQFADGTNAYAAAADVLAATKAVSIAQINAECRARLVARYGTAEEQVSRALGIYGAAERDAMEAGISATIDASNTASDAVINAATVAQAEAVTVTWPALP